MFLAIVLSFCVGALLAWAAIRLKQGTFEENVRKSLRDLEGVLREKIARAEDGVREREKGREELLALDTKNIKNERARLKERAQEIAEKELLIRKAEKQLQQKERMLLDMSKKEEELIQRYEKLSFMTREMAKQELLSTMEQEVSVVRKERLLSMREDLLQHAQDALQSALERVQSLCTKEYFVETTSFKTSYEKVVPKLIGKEGRNIQTLEKCLSVHISFDSKEQVASIASSNSEMRWIAKNVLLSLSDEEKVTPAIVLREIESIKQALGSSLIPEVHNALEASVPEALSLPREIHVAINHLFFSNSLGQNLFAHSLEVARLMKRIAEELSLPPNDMALTGLLHDIGKVLDTSWGRTHSKAGARFLEVHGIADRITSAILAHHGEEKKSSLEAIVLACADRVSGGCLRAREIQEKTPPHKALLCTIEEEIQAHPHVLSAWASFRPGDAGDIEAVVKIRPSLDAEAKSIMTNALIHVVERRSMGSRVRITFLE